MPLQAPPLPTAVATNKPATTRRKIFNSSRTVRSLALFLLANLIWPLIIILLFPTGQARPKPDWAPSDPAVHVATLGSAFFMGLAGWIVWADGAFSAQNANALPDYVTRVFTGVTWQPAVLGLGSAELGWVFCVVNLVVLVSCYGKFKKANPFAGALVTPALAWSVYLFSVTHYLVYLGDQKIISFIVRLFE